MTDNSAYSNTSMNEFQETTQGIEDIPFDDQNEVVSEFVDDEFYVEEDMDEIDGIEDGEEDNDQDIGEDVDEDAVEDDAIDEEDVTISVNSIDDVGNIDLKSFSPHEIVKFDFISLEMAYEFYKLYARVNGFAVRKSNIIKSKTGIILQQSFVCNREGRREEGGLTVEKRKRKPRTQTRCGCKAEFRVHIDMYSMRWRVTYFLDEHNHTMLEGKYVGMLPAFRKMNKSDIMEMNYYRNAGIPPYLMYGSFACQSGGYEKIGFSQKNIYNQIGRQRRQQESDAKACLDYLHGLGSSDPMMFCSHTVDGEGRLQHLFWSDGTSQMDYKVFGDALAFDSTYRKNKYRCPVVVFCGINHHHQSIVFATAIIANETEETYMWLLNEFLKVMKGKSPLTVITDGDAAMRNAIKSVFPNAHHRLCAWHLLRNATTNIGIPAFTSTMNKCMFGDLDVGQFQKMWKEMVDNFGLHDNGWVAQMYEKRKMWAVAYMRGKFFGGLRTTSRCEGLNAQISRFVKSRYNLTEFVEHFNRLLLRMRFREFEADFQSHYGEPVWETEFNSLERSGEEVFIREIFSEYCGILSNASVMNVVGCRETVSYTTFVLQKNTGRGKERYVSFSPSSYEFKCSCFKMESIGIPCEHILAVLVYLNIEKLPKCLVLDRWTKYAKDQLQCMSSDASNSWPSQLTCRYVVLMQQYRELAALACKSFECYCIEREKARNSIEDVRAKVASTNLNDSGRRDDLEGVIRDPARVASRGRGGLASSSSGLKSRKTVRCRFCKIQGHNKKSCKAFRQHVGMVES